MYTRLETRHFPDKVIRINDKDNNMVAIIIADMPKELVSSAFEEICTTFPGMVQSRSDDDKNRESGFASLHFSYYNRYSKKVSMRYTVD